MLVHLELPALRSHADVVAVELAADRMPNLRELVISRAYMRFGDRRVELARAKVRHPVAWPWPPVDEIDGYVIEVAGASASASVLIDALEQLYDQLPADVRASWFTIWTELGTAYGTRVRATVLLQAIDSLGLDDNGWRVTVNNLKELHTEVYVRFGPE